MPARPYSARILTGTWPTTNFADWLDVAEGLNLKANELDDSAASIRRESDVLGVEGSGQMIEAMCDCCYRTAQTVQNQSDEYFTMAEAVNRCAELGYGACEDLDRIDAKAHEEIQRLKQLAASHKGSAGLVAQAIEAVIAAAQAEAHAAADGATAAITTEAARIGADTGGLPAAPGAGGNSASPSLDNLREQGGVGGGGSMADGIPTGLPLGRQPLSTGPNQEDQPPTSSDTQTGFDGPSSTGGDSDPQPDGADARQPGKGGQVTEAGTHGTGSDPAAASIETGFDGPPPVAPIAPVTPATSSGGAGGVSPLGTGGGGFKMPASTGLPSGTGSVAPVSPAGLNPAAGLSTPAAGAVPPPASAADFSGVLARAWVLAAVGRRCFHLRCRLLHRLRRHRRAVLLGCRCRRVPLRSRRHQVQCRRPCPCRLPRLCLLVLGLWAVLWCRRARRQVRFRRSIRTYLRVRLR